MIRRPFRPAARTYALPSSITAAAVSRLLGAGGVHFLPPADPQSGYDRPAASAGDDSRSVPRSGSGPERRRLGTATRLSRAATRAGAQPDLHRQHALAAVT